MKNKKIWFKSMWLEGDLIPCSKGGWIAFLIGIALAFFFGLNFGGPVTNTFSLQFNGIAFVIVILTFITVAYIKSE